MSDKVPTTDAIRHAISRGAAGDKVSFPDPAAAPLGTDAEAAGFPPTKRERRIEARRLGPMEDRTTGGIFATWLGYGSIVLAIALALFAIILAGTGGLR